LKVLFIKRNPNRFWLLLLVVSLKGKAGILKDLPASCVIYFS
jgi:hypothetical protein